MLKESYVSFDTAKLLKEVGFEANLKTIYVEEEKDEWAFWDSGAKRSDYNYFDDTIACPTQALAARWLREAHGIHVSSNIFMDSANDADGKTVDEWTFWSYNLFDNSGRIIEESDDRYDSYEEALEAGLKRALELIKK